ncbi:Nucleolar complex protein 3 [Gurleya vavrai]
MTTEYYKNLSKLSKLIINDPYKNITLIDDILKTNDDVTLLSLLKIFKNIIPLYKIKIIEDKINHKKEYIKLNNHDRSLFHFYKKFVNRICILNTKVSFVIAVEILKSLDHFNFIEKIIVKIIKGFDQSKDIVKICADGIVGKLNTDEVGESTFKILIELLEFKGCKDVYRGLTDIKIMNKLELDDITIEKKTKEDKKKKRLLLKNIYGKEIEKSSLKSKTDKKIDIKNKKVEEKIRTKNKEEQDEAKKKMLGKIVDNAMRIFFIILKEEMIDLYTIAIQGLTEYRRFIKNSFMEGLMIMLEKIIIQENMYYKLHGSNCVLEIFGQNEFEFRNIINAVYDLLTPLKYSFTYHEKMILCNMIRKLFLFKRQSVSDVFTFLHRLMQNYLVDYHFELQIIIKEIINSYKIDVYDFDTINNGVYSFEESDTKLVAMLPLFECTTLYK